MTARTPAALRASLDARLLLVASERMTDVNRLRRHLTFQRILRRLAADERWVLKGGYLLEARLGARARATRDLDLTSAVNLEADDLRASITAALATDVDADGFVFRVTGARPHLADDGSGLHLSVSADLAGRPFATVRIDVVARPDEVAGGTERVVLAPVIDVEGWAPVAVPAVDLGQHVAEKLHALCSLDAHPRPSTRVKDLVDIVLLLDAGVLDEAHAADRLHAVFRARHTPWPQGLPTPPAAWRADYAALVAQIGHELPAYDEALASARALVDRLTRHDLNPDHQEPHP